MTTLRTNVENLLIANGAEKVSIRPNGQIRVRKNGTWSDAGRVGDYAQDAANARVTDSDKSLMNSGYGTLD